MDTICVEENYGPVTMGTEYEVLEEGLDYTRIRCHGRPINIPNYLLARRHYRKTKEDLITYEEIIAADEE